MARIVIVSYWFEPNLGAAPNRIKNFIKFFVKKGHEVILYTGQKDAPSYEEFLVRRTNLKHPRLVREINKLNPAIVILSVPPTFGIQNFKKLKDLKKRFIFDIRDPLAYNYATKIPIKKVLLWQYEKYFLEHSYLNIINSPGIGELYNKKKVLAQYYFLPNGYNKVLFSEKKHFNGKFFYFGAFNIMHSTINFYKFFKNYKKEIEKRRYIFDFYCFDSPQLMEIKEIVEDEQWKFIHFFKPIVEIEFKEKLKDYSIGLTFVRTVFNYSIPSKFYTYLALGIPTMNISFGRSFISRLCRKYEVGFDINPNDFDLYFFDKLENNYTYYNEKVLENRDNFNWNKLIEEFYNLKLYWLK